MFLPLAGDKAEAKEANDKGSSGLDGNNAKQKAVVNKSEPKRSKATNAKGKGKLTCVHACALILIASIFLYVFAINLREILLFACP